LGEERAQIDSIIRVKKRGCSYHVEEKSPAADWEGRGIGGSSGSGGSHDLRYCKKRRGLNFRRRRNGALNGGVNEGRYEKDGETMEEKRRRERRREKREK